MAEATLSEASARFAATLKDPERSSVLAEVTRFVRWYGADRPVGQLRGHDVSLYADVLGPTTPESSRRANQVRTYLAFLKKEGLTATNLAPHLRLRKTGPAVGGPVGRREVPVHLTKEGVAALEAEMETLLEQRIKAREEIRRAMLDKDFRENAPLDAAKEKQGHLEARIREIEGMLKRAELVEEAPRGDRTRVGSTVIVLNVGSGKRLRYTIVGPTEASATDGKISSASPVGKALLDRRAGDEVEVSVPSGTLRLRVEEIES